jgi:hypothetical protein
MDIENKIITLLNEADSKMNQQEFSALAESVIDYIDEIARSKKQPVSISPDAIELIGKIDKTIQKFGTYSYDDKGPYEVMNMKEIMIGLQVKPITEIGKILSEVLDNYPVYGRAHSFVCCVIGELDYLPEEEFDKLFDLDERFEY